MIWLYIIEKQQMPVYSKNIIYAALTLRGDCYLEVSIQPVFPVCQKPTRKCYCA